MKNLSIQFLILLLALIGVIKMQRTLKEEIKFLERILSENSNSILFARLSDAYLKADRVDDAIELCEFGVKKHPAYVTGHFILGKCYLQKKLFDQAEKELKRAILYDPQYIAAHREYAELMAQIGWHTTCEMAYEEIIRIDPINEKAKKRLEDLKKQFFHQQEQKKEHKTKFAIKEVDEILPSRTEQIQEETEIVEEKNDYFGLDLDIPEEQAEEDTMNIPDESDASMELLEDIFRDTTIPDLGAEEHFYPEKNVNQDVEPESKKAAEQAAPFEEPIKTPKFKPSPFQELEEQLYPEERIKQDVEPEITTPAEENTKTPGFEPSPLQESEEQIEPDESIKQDVESELKSSAEMESSEDVLYGFESEKAREQKQNDIFKLVPEIESEEKDVEISIEPSRSESEVDDRPIQVGDETHTQTPDKESQINEKEKIVTPTLGEIYAAQHQYSKAISVYELLMKNDPDNETYKQKIDYLYKKSEESKNE